eukprot:145498_1
MLYLQITFGQSYLSTPINAIYWFEGRGIKSQNAYGVIQRVITAFASPINNFNMFSDNIIRLLDDEFEFSQNRKNRFRINCNKFRKTLYDYYKSNMKDTHPTVKFFKSARWFNIDSIVSPPDSCKDAHVGIPWGWGFLSSNRRLQVQLENEWGQYIIDLGVIQKKPIDLIKLCIYGDNGDRCLNYFQSKLETWRLLAPVAIRTLKVVVGTADVERIFSVYNYYLGALDAVNLGIDHKQAKAFLLQNKKHI